MGGVDKANQLIAYYCPDLRCRRTWMPILFHILDCMRVNAYIACKAWVTRAHTSSLQWSGARLYLFAQEPKKYAICALCKAVYQTTVRRLHQWVASRREEWATQNLNYHTTYSKATRMINSWSVAQSHLLVRIVHTCQLSTSWLKLGLPSQPTYKNQILLFCMWRLLVQKPLGMLPWKRREDSWHSKEGHVILS